jgi:hypothetical protein
VEAWTVFPVTTVSADDADPCLMFVVGIRFACGHCRVQGMQWRDVEKVEYKSSFLTKDR